MDLGHIYIIEAEDGPIKIGMSIQPETRIAKLAVSSGRAILRQFISPAIPEFAILESALHRHFWKSRTIGEWFEVPFDEAVKMAHWLGARVNPAGWTTTDCYVRGAIARKRVDEFSTPDRTQAEWDAFIAGMGQEAWEDFRFSEDVDFELALHTAKALSERLAETMRLQSMLGIPMPPSAQAVWDQLRAIHDDTKRDIESLRPAD